MISRALAAIERLSLRSPRATFAASALLLGLSVVALARVRVVTDVSEIIHTPSLDAFKRAAAIFGLEQQAFLLVESDRQGREAHLVRFAESLKETLKTANLVESVDFSLPLDPEALVEKVVFPYGPLYFQEESLAELDRLLSKEGLREQAEKQASRMGLAGLGAAEEWAERDPLELGRAFVARARTLQGKWRVSPGSSWFLSEDGRALLVVVRGKKEASQSLAGARDVVGAIDDACGKLLKESWAAGLSVCATGGFHFSEESERIIRGDLTESISTAFVLCALIVAIGLRVWKPHAVLLLCAPVVWGTIVAIGLFAAAKASLTGLSLMSAAVLVGLGSDYSIHVACAALELRSKGLAAREAILTGIRQTWTGLLGSVFTSIAAFLAYLASDLAFLREMGLLTAIGLFVCLLAAVLVLPPILLFLLGSEGPVRRGGEPRTLGVAFTSRQAIRFPGLVVFVSLVASVAAAAWLVRSPLLPEDDLRNVQARGSKPLAAQERIAQVFGGSQEPIAILIEEKDEKEVVSACERLERPLARLVADGTIVSRASIAPLLPSEESQRKVVDLLAKKDPERIGRELRETLENTGFDASRFERAVSGVVAAVSQRETLTVEKLRALGLAPLLDRFVATKDGKSYALVLVNPKTDLWSQELRAALRGKLEAALREAGARGELTSLFLVSDESARRVESDFRRITLLTLIGVTAVVVVQFRRPAKILLVLLPPALGLLWTAALFSLLGYKLNLMNLGVLPMLYGIGIDDGIYPVDRFFAHKSSGVAEAFRWKGGAMVVCMTTTMVSFGSLALSQSRGIASVGVLTFVGLGLCLVASFVTLPAVLALMSRKESGGSA